MGLIKWFRQLKAAHSPSPLPEPERTIKQDDLDLLGVLFGSEEARKQLLGIATQKNVSPEQVLRDAQAIEVMMRTFPWRIYNEAIWRKLVESLRGSLTESFVGPNKQTIFLTPEQREGFRHEAVALISVLKLPHELKQDKDRVLRAQQLQEEALNK